MPAGNTAPAPTRLSLPTLLNPVRTDAVPMRTLSPTVLEWTIAPWPIVQFAPMIVGAP